MKSVHLVCPAGPGYDEARRRLQRALDLPDERVFDADAPVAEDLPVVALGNMMDSAFLRRLYLCLDDVTDRAWPGPGGHVLRTHPTPQSRGGSVLVVGVSDAADAPAAAGALAARVTPAGALPAFLHEVQPGRYADLYEQAAAPFLEPPETPWEETGGAGDWDYMMLIARMGMAAIKTGRVPLIETFVAEVQRFAEVRFFHRRREDPIMIHGFLRHMLVPFLWMEHHPAVDAAARARVHEAFLGILRSEEGARNARLLHEADQTRVRQNHDTRSALDIYVAGRYYRRVHGLTEGAEWMDLARRFFEPQLGAAKPVEDSWGHQWVATLYTAADFALQDGRDDYVAGPVLAAAADRALLAHSNVEEGPLLYLLMAAAATGDDGYLLRAMRDGEDELAARAVPKVGADETGRSWVTGRASAERADLTGLARAPLARLFYDSIEAYDGYAPAGVYRRDVPYEDTFDKIAWRAGWSDDDDYLLLDGVSGGSHSFQDTGCLVRFTQGGRDWFGGPWHGRWSTASVREHCGVAVTVDGRGAGSEPRYARKIYDAVLPGAAVFGCQVDNPGFARWRRHVVCGEGGGVPGWFLCVDEVEALTPGDFLVEGRWNLRGEVELDDAGARVRQDGAGLRLRSLDDAGNATEEIVGPEGRAGTRWVRRLRASLDAGQVLRLAVAWRAGDGEVELDAAPEGDGFRVEGTPVGLGGGEAPAAVAAGVELPGIAQPITASAAALWAEVGTATGRALEPAWRRTAGAPVTAMIALADGWAVGDDRGAVCRLDVEGVPRFEARPGPGPVRALAGWPEGGLAAAGDDETVRVLDAAGAEVWARRLEWQPMSWETWSRGHCGISSLHAADLDGDGRVELVAGCADRHLYAFDADGVRRWRAPCRWGVPVCLDSRPADGVRRQVLTGLAQPAIHGWCPVYDEAGTFLKNLERPDIACWSIPSWLRVLRVAEIAGRARVCTGLDTNHRQLLVYGADDAPAWDADLGAAVTALEVEGDQLVAGTAQGFVQAFDADGGTRRWQTFLADPVLGLAPSPEGVLAATQGGVYRLDAEGRPVAGICRVVVRAARRGADLLVADDDGDLTLYPGTHPSEGTVR